MDICQLKHEVQSLIKRLPDYHGLSDNEIKIVTYGDNHVNYRYEEHGDEDEKYGICDNKCISFNSSILFIGDDEYPYCPYITDIHNGIIDFVIFDHSKWDNYSMVFSTFSIPIGKFMDMCRQYIYFKILTNNMLVLPEFNDIGFEISTNFTLVMLDTNRIFGPKYTLLLLDDYFFIKNTKNTYATY